MSELLQDSQTTDSARKQIAILQQQARRAAEIVHNLTYFATPPTPGKTRVNMGEIVERTLNLHAYSLRKNNITVTSFANRTALRSGRSAPADAGLFEFDFECGAGHSRRTRPGNVTHSSGNQRGQSVWASFLDDGPGIPSDILASIFDPFYTTKRPGRGTGLGLSICKSVMKEHNGTVEAANAPGGGAVFTVTLPAAAAFVFAEPVLIWIRC